MKNKSSQARSNDILNTVAGSAKHYQDKEIEGKLKLLVSSQLKFDELIEFGFPIQMQSSDLSLVGESSASISDSGSPTLPSLQHQQNLTLEQIRESLDTPRKMGNYEDESRYSMTSSNLMSPMSAVPREMTLKFTLTPASMRADEAILYGWQKTMESSDSLEAYEEEDPMDPGLAGGNGEHHPLGFSANTTARAAGPGVLITDTQASSSIPVGGLGKDAANSKTMMKRVFGKLKKAPKTTGPSVMITSADME